MAIKPSTKKAMLKKTRPASRRQAQISHPVAPLKTAKATSRPSSPLAARRSPLNAQRSPHLLDLSSMADALDDQTTVTAHRVPPTAQPSPLALMLDRLIHCRDLKSRSLSARQKSWHDFPPAEASTLGQAVAITAVKFLREHAAAASRIGHAAYLIAKLGALAVSFPLRVALRLLRLSSPLTQFNRRIGRWLELYLLTEPAEAVSKKHLRISARGPRRAARTPLSSPFLRFLNYYLLTDPRQVTRYKLHARLSRRSLTTAVLLAATATAGILAANHIRSAKAVVTNLGQDGLRSLRAALSAAEARDFKSSGEEFREASRRFDEAEKRLGILGRTITAIAMAMPGGRTLAGAALLEAGGEFALGGRKLAEGFASLEGSGSLASSIESAKTSIDAALPHIERAAEYISKVPSSAVPADYRQTLVRTKSETPELLRLMRRARLAAAALPQILGYGQTKRYLVIFQNNAELRPTGGFIGSFALLDVKDGNLRKMEIPGGGSYDLKGSLRLKLVSPQPLRLINPHWQFQDANWSPDFPTSAKTLVRFYEKSGGPTVDGVIAINASLMEDLLGLIGPVSMPEYGKTVSRENFFDATQQQVEHDYDKAENKPKKFIADLAPKVLDAAIRADRGTHAKLAGILGEALAKKDLQLWLRDSGLQNRISELGWSGEMKTADSDYLAIIHTNIAGQKTDRAMRDLIDHAVKILPDGSGVVTLTIKRTHTGKKGEMWTGARNVDYARVYAPAGSVLVEASGFKPPDPKLFKIPDRGYALDDGAAENSLTIHRSSGTRISSELGKTVFGNWLQTDPGETSAATIVYRLPASVFKPVDKSGPRLPRLHASKDARDYSYSLFVERQAGANPMTFASSLDLPRGAAIIWQSPTRSEDERGRMTVTKTLDRDALFGTVIKLR